MLDSVVLRAMPLAVLVALAAGLRVQRMAKSVSRGWGGSRRPGLRHLPRAQAQGLGAAGFPALAGTPAAYLAKQIADFRSGARMNPVMQPIATALSDAEVSAVAAKPGRHAPAHGKGGGSCRCGCRSRRKAGAAGAWDRNVPECVACHGPGGVGWVPVFRRSPGSRPNI